MSDDFNKYIRYNFHRLSSWNRANGILSNLKAGDAHVILLTGEVGSGRDYFAKGLTYNFNHLNRGNAMFAALNVSDASQKEALSEFQNFLSPHGGNYTIEAKVGTPGLFGFSIALMKELKIKPSHFFHDCGTDIPEDDLYTRIIQLTSDARRKKTLVLHLSNFMDISDSLLRAISTLLDRESSELNPLLITIQGEKGSWKKRSYHGEFFSKARRWQCFDEMQFAPLEAKEIKAVFGYRFPNRDIPFDFFEDLQKITGGIPREIALVTSYLIAEEILNEKTSGTWIIDRGSNRYGKAFKKIEGSKCYLNYREKIEDLQLKEFIDTFLEYAAVCGEYVPVYTILEAMGVPTKEEKDQLILRIDEYIGEDTEDPIFEDLDLPEEFSPLYSNLPDELMYRFLKKWLIIFFRTSRKRDRQIARDLLPLYEMNSGANRKDQCKILYRLAELAEDKEKIQTYDLYLKVWYTTSDIEHLKKLLDRDLEHGSLKIKTLLNIFYASENVLNVSVRIAIAKALLECRLDSMEYSACESVRRYLIQLEFQAGNYSDVIGLCNSYPAPEKDFFLLHHRGLAEEKMAHYNKAHSDFCMALEICEREHGPYHPDVAVALVDLAGLYREQGKYGQAESSYLKALKILEAALGPNHYNVAGTLNNLAKLYESQGNYNQAEPIYQKALEIYEAVLGPDHPDVATTLNNLAKFYESQEKYDQAEPIYQRALQIYEAVLGPDHPLTEIVRKSYENLGTSPSK